MILSAKQKERKMKTLSYSKYMAVLLGTVLLGCGEDVSVTIKHEKPADPPMSVTLRQGVLSQWVLQVNNMSSEKALEIKVYARDDQASTGSGNVFLPANQAKEFGALEMNWKFKAGDKGFVEAVGYERKLFFEILKKGQYRKWFGVNDIPETDVAATVAAECENRVKVENEATLKEWGRKGRELFVAITAANVEREAAGLHSLWPKCANTKTDKIKGYAQSVIKKFKKSDDEDFANRQYLNSAEYFNDLLDTARYGGETHKPYIKGGLSLIVGKNHKHEAGTRVKSQDIQWCVLADCGEDLPDWVPVIISSNFPCDTLKWGGDSEGAVSLGDVGDLGRRGVVVVLKGGTAKALDANEVTLSKIFEGVPRADVRKELRGVSLNYLTPSGIVQVKD